MLLVHQQQVISRIMTKWWAQSPPPIGGGGILSSTNTIVQSPALVGAAYMVAANYFYVARRARLRRQTKGYIWSVRTTREKGVSWPLFVTFLFAWQAIVVVYPLLEPLTSLFGFASFVYSYPNAQGFGYILEPLALQDESSSVRSKNQIRFDWHRFMVNVGPIGRNGYRHPPSVQRNLPHIDIPSRHMKHWPWRRRCRSKGWRNPASPAKPNTWLFLKKNSSIWRIYPSTTTTTTSRKNCVWTTICFHMKKDAPKRPCLPIYLGKLTSWPPRASNSLCGTKSSTNIRT